MYIVLALVSAALAGAWSFGLGLFRGRISTNGIVFVSGVAAAIVYLMTGVLRDGLVFDARDVRSGLVGGLLNVTGTILLVKAYERGKMGVVAGVSAMFAIVPLVYSLLIGEPLRPTGVVGIALCVVGLLLFLRRQGDAPTANEDEGGQALVAVALAAGTALLWGLAIVVLDVGSRVSLSGTLLVSEVPEILVLLVLIARARSFGGVTLRPGVVLVAAGVALGLSNLTLYAAANMGDIGVVSVLGSLSPIVTALLALVVVPERMARIEVTALAIVVAGTCLVVI